MEKKIDLDITGMTCASCSALIQRALEKDERVKKASVNIATNRASVVFDEDKISSVDLIELVKKTGYGASISDYENDDSAKIVKSRYLCFLWSFIFGLPLFYLAMGMLVGLPELKISMMANLFWQLVFTLAIIIINRHIYFSGFSKLFKRQPNMDSLIAIGTLVAFLYSVFIYLGTLFYPEQVSSAHVYFESAGFILIFIALGKYLEERAKGRTGNAIKKLIGLQPKTALVSRDNKEVEISISELVKGDIVIVKAGDKIPVDGQIIFGESTIDESAITGESIPVFKKVGDKLIGGTINKTSILKFKATGVGSETMLAQIIKIMEEAVASKALIQLLVDKVSYYFVPTVIVLAIISFLVWYFLGFGFYFALTAFVSVLIIACPCALGLATPTAVMMGTGLAAKNGILIKSSAALEAANKIQAVVFDKTGTLTKGHPEVVEIFGFGFSEAQILKISQALARNSRHPLSEAVARYAKERNAPRVELDNFEEKEGMGLKAFCREHKTKLLLGNKKLLELEGLSFSAEVEAVFDRFASSGKTPLFISHGDKVAGLIAIIDDIKDSSLEAVKELKRRGQEVYMITGDNEKVAQAIAEKLGIDKVLANVFPADKAKKIKELQDSGLVVAMVGDGINDAPALAQANLGIALASGTDVALEAGEIILVKNDLRDVVKAIDISKFTLNKIRQNLFWAFIYNILGIPVAAGVFYFIFGVLLNPMIAALAMSFSSVSVVSNSLLMKFYRR